MGEEEVVKRSVSRDNEILETSPLHSCAENRSLPDLLSLSLSLCPRDRMLSKKIDRAACVRNTRVRQTALYDLTRRRPPRLASPRHASSQSSGNYDRRSSGTNYLGDFCVEEVGG